jgi:hypothetical protein
VHSGLGRFPEAITLFLGARSDRDNIPANEGPANQRLYNVLT